MTNSSGKHLEDTNLTHIASLMYKLITSARDTNDLFIDFDRDRGRRQQEWSNNKNITGKYHVRIMLKDVFSFAENPEKATYGLG